MKPTDVRAGFALPLAVLILLISAGAALTTLSSASSERRIVDSEHAGNNAFVLAESGLAQALTQADAWGWSALPNATLDSTRITFATGYVDVIRERIRPWNDPVPALYLIRSKGVYTRGGWGGAPAAVRVITRYGTWTDAKLDVRAAWSSISGLHKNGGSGTIDGTDACAAEDAVAGVAVPDDPGYDQNGGDPVPTGDPPVASLGANAEEAAAGLDLDWENIVNGGAVPDIIIPGDSWPDFSDPDYWPVIYIDNAGGNYTLPADGRGTLIVRGDLTISGSEHWDGILLVGGAITSNGNNNIQGATITGLNVKLGEAVGVSDLGNGTKTYVYNSCAVANALHAFGGLRLLTNTWFDGWAMY